MAGSGLCNLQLVAQYSVALRGDRRMDGGRSGFFSRYNYYNVMWHQQQQQRQRYYYYYHCRADSPRAKPESVAAVNMRLDCLLVS